MANVVEVIFRGVDQLSQEVNRATRNTDTLIGTLRRVGGAIAGAFALDSITATVDEMTLLENRLRVVAGRFGSIRAVQRDLFSLAQETRSALSGVSILYSRIALNSEELGLSHQRILDLTKAVNQAVQISGGTAQEAAAGIIQFSQAIASGVLRGDELRSITEQMPRLAKAISDGLGVTIGDLRRMGAEGELGAKRVINALESQKEVLDKEFGSTEFTIGQSFTQLGNSLKVLADNANEASGATKTIGAGVRFLARSLEEIDFSSIKIAKLRAELVFLAAEAQSIELGITMRKNDPKLKHEIPELERQLKEVRDQALNTMVAIRALQDTPTIGPDLTLPIATAPEGSEAAAKMIAELEQSIGALTKSQRELALEQVIANKGSYEQGQNILRLTDAFERGQIDKQIKEIVEALEEEVSTLGLSGAALQEHMVTRLMAGKTTEEYTDLLKRAADARAAIEEHGRSQKIDDFVKQMQEEVGALGKTGVALTQYRLQLLGAEEGTQEYIDAVAAAAKIEEFDRAESIKSIIDALREQAATYGESARAISLYRLALAEAKPEEIAEANKLWDEIEAATRRLELRRTAAERFRRGEMSQIFDPDEGPVPEGFEIEDPLQDMARHFDGMVSDFEEATDEMSVFAEQAARNIQDFFADWLFDPFEEGLKGMLRGFIDVLRRMVAEALAANILKAIFGEETDKNGNNKGLLGLLMNFGLKTATGAVAKTSPVQQKPDLGALISGGMGAAAAASGAEGGFFDEVIVTPKGTLFSQQKSSNNDLQDMVEAITNGGLGAESSRSNGMGLFSNLFNRRAEEKQSGGNDLQDMVEALQGGGKKKKATAGLGNFFGSILGAFLGKGLAVGGWTGPAGMIHPVNEREPEFLISPSRSQVVPLSKMAAAGFGGRGGGTYAPSTTMNVNSNISPLELEALIRRNNDMMMARFKQMMLDGVLT